MKLKGRECPLSTRANVSLTSKYRRSVHIPDDSRHPLCTRQTSVCIHLQYTKEYIPMALLNAKLFLNPVTTTTTSRLSKTVPTPTVNAIRGTALISLLKKRAFARMVSYARVLMRVRDAREDPSETNSLVNSRIKK